ncbi:flagellar filament capping protein FliD [Sinobaca sp. H24]|uniref:flagellar filament capping protein FliD n=1 Tax=Sinobaca sp. H24 TaxID=2923376 RepID=UPI00207999FC|nr:flagellar filament capping protein FliD [Sinobaca sp. H24]
MAMNRVTGFGSGMDINQMVKDLMRAERMPMDKLTQKKTTIAYQMEEYRSVNRMFNDFRTSTFDTVMRASNMQARTAASTNDARVTSTANAEAGNSSYQLSEVRELAKAASLTTSARVGDETFKSTASLGSQSYAANAPEWKTGVTQKETLRADGTQTTFTVSKDNLKTDAAGDMIIKGRNQNYEVVTGDAVLTANQVRVTFAGDGSSMELEFGKAPASGDVSVDYFTTSATQSFNPTAAQSTFSIGKGSIDPATLDIRIGGGGPLTVVTDPDQTLQAGEAYLNSATGQIRLAEATTEAVEVNYTQQYETGAISTFNAEGKEVKEQFIIQSGQSLDQVMTAVRNSKVGVQGFYDQFTGNISMNRSETGKFNPDGPEMTFEGNFFQNTLGLGSANYTDASNAKFTLNGMDTERTSNTFTVNGMTMTLKDTFTAAEGAVTLSSTVNTDGVFDTVKGFVDEYNKMLETINGKLKETLNRDYPPLTDEQRAELSESEIEKWDKLAQSGMIRNDRIISNAMTTIRNDLYGSVSGSSFGNLTSLGITTTRNYMDGGKLEIDETKLRAAIESDAEGVFNVFAANGETKNEQGVARRMRESLDTAITQIAERAGGLKGKVQNNQFTLGRELMNTDDRISDFERKLTMIEDRYWRQFSAMEKAMSAANNQSNMIFSMFNSNQ